MMGSNTHHIASPDGHIIVTFEVSKKGEIFYRIVRGGEVVLSQSRLGLKLKDVPDMITGFSVAVFGVILFRNRGIRYGVKNR